MEVFQKKEEQVWRSGVALAVAAILTIPFSSTADVGGTAGTHGPAGATRPTLLVKFKSTVTREQAEAVLRPHGATEVAPLRRATSGAPSPMDRWWKAGFATGANLAAIASALSKEPSIEAVEEEQTFRIQ